jgi:hypothetical protein
LTYLGFWVKASSLVLQNDFPSVEVKPLVVRSRNTIRPKRLKGSYILAGGASVLLIGLLALIITFPSLTYKGVPLSILLRFVKDPIARQAYFDGDKTGLHNRLDHMGVEDDIKAFYRPKFQDEQALDLYIHQLLYKNTGYVGTAYRLNEQGQLVPRSTLPPDFEHWLALAQQLNFVVSHEIQNGVIYVKTPQGSRVPYTTMASLYSISDMEQWTAMKNR